MGLLRLAYGIRTTFRGVLGIEPLEICTVRTRVWYEIHSRILLAPARQFR
jgi:hypothetical protein